MDTNKKESQRVDWSTYDRVSPTTIQLNDGEKVPFKGIIIGHRKYLGLADYLGMPLFVTLAVSLIPAYIKTWYDKLPSDGWRWTIFVFSLLLGVLSGLFLFRWIYQAKKANDKVGNANIYLNLDKRLLGIRDRAQKGEIIPLDQIQKVSLFRLFSLQMGGLSFKLYARLIITWNDGKRKRITIVHFMDNPESSLHTINDIIHENKDTALPEVKTSD
ncbi:MAG: hypothetical protein LKJ88_07230 [Bacilli bacterium]|jgi:MFS family permease|nr:hypothetical protein [Bacilli bacterium]